MRHNMSSTSTAVSQIPPALTVQHSKSTAPEISPDVEIIDGRDAACPITTCSHNTQSLAAIEGGHRQTRNASLCTRVFSEALVELRQEALVDSLLVLVS